MKQGASIFFYDGDCGFCNNTVMFLLDRTKRDTLKFCALQSDYSQRKLKEHGIEKIDFSSSYLIKESKVYSKSSAILQAGILMGNTLKIIFYFGFVVPKFIRDRVYDFIATRRLRLTKTNCRMLTSEERKRFIYEI